MTTTRQTMTAEDLMRLPDDGRRYELLDGVIVEMSPGGNVQGMVASNFGFELTAFVRPRNLGVVASNEPGIFLRRNPDRVRSPDVYVLLRERIPAGGLPAGYMDVIPDLVVEVVSPNDTAAEVEQKVQEWLAAGARLVLVAYPATRSVIAHRGGSEMRYYAAADTLDAEPVLAGFACSVASLFE